MGAVINGTAVPDVATWDIAIADGGAARPSLDQVGGALLENDDTEPPAMDGTEPEASVLNQQAMQLACLGRVAASVKITVDVTSGTPAIAGVSAAGATIVSGDFTLTDGGVGITDIEWVSGKLPPMVCDPTCTNNHDSDTTVSATVVASNKVRIKTRTAGALADTRWTVEIN